MLLAALLLALLSTENSGPAEEAKTAALPPDLAKIPSDAVFIASGRVADLWDNDINKSVRQKLGKEMNEAAGEFEKRFGLPMDQVERLSLVILQIQGPPEPLFFVGTTKEYNRDNVLSAVAARKQEKYNQQTYYVRGEDWAVYPLGARALAYGSARAIRELIDRPSKSDGNLASALQLAAGKHSAVYAMNVKAFNETVGDKLPGETEPFKPLLQALYGTLTVDLGAETRAEIKLTFASEKDAQAAVMPAGNGLDLARAGLDRAVEDLTQKEMRKFVELLKQVQESLKATRVEQQGKALKAAAQLKVDMNTVGLVLAEAVQKIREATARTQSMNNLKQIALAMINYADAMAGSLPANAIYDKNGKALLSWRVQILPFIEQQELYNEFHLNEPWDSRHNKMLLAKMPKIYASPEDGKTLKDHTTYYQGFHGKGGFFEGKQGLRFPASIPDGTSNTFMIVEASKPVPWTKPEDIPNDPAKRVPKLGRPGAAGFLAAMCDGSVRFCSHKIAQQTLHLVIQTNDGMPIPADF
jgi:hypothetical protein